MFDFELTYFRRDPLAQTGLRFVQRLVEFAEQGLEVSQGVGCAGSRPGDFLAQLREQLVQIGLSHCLLSSCAVALARLLRLQGEQPHDDHADSLPPHLRA